MEGRAIRRGLPGRLGRLIQSEVTSGNLALLEARVAAAPAFATLFAERRWRIRVGAATSQAVTNSRPGAGGDRTHIIFSTTFSIKSLMTSSAVICEIVIPDGCAALFRRSSFSFKTVLVAPFIKPADVST
jgi:hypothetical protein